MGLVVSEVLTRQPPNPQGRASLPARLHLSQVTDLNKPISC